MVDQLSDIRVTFKPLQDFLLALQADFGRILEYDLPVRNSTVYVFSGYRVLMLDGMNVPTWRSRFGREASLQQHTCLSHLLPPGQPAETRP
jgi:hypothetical protein